MNYELNGFLVSELGWKAGKSLDMIFNGLHNIPHTIKSRKLFDLTREDYIEVIVNYGLDFSTYDFDRLTRACIAGHIFQVRIEISPHGKGYTCLRFHNRGPKGHMWSRHPSVSDLQDRITELCKQHSYAPGIGSVLSTSLKEK